MPSQNLLSTAFFSCKIAAGRLDKVRTVPPAGFNTLRDETLNALERIQIE